MFKPKRLLLKKKLLKKIKEKKKIFNAVLNLLQYFPSHENETVNFLSVLF